MLGKERKYKGLIIDNICKYDCMYMHVLLMLVNELLNYNL